uniref:Uncharacterized protein n=1 Tax=Cannabis sativa TaxID=3483 RepID=A0A803NUA9_CANSA
MCSQHNTLRVNNEAASTMMQKFWDAEVRSMFGDFIWQGHKDASRANFDQAVKASPDDCFVLASYARFLWDYEEDDDEEETNTESLTPNFFRGTTLLLLKLSTLVRDLLFDHIGTQYKNRVWIEKWLKMELGVHYSQRFNATDAANFSDATTAACDTNAQMPQIYRQMSKVSTTLLSIYVGDCKAAIRRE